MKNRKDLEEDDLVGTLEEMSFSSCSTWDKSKINFLFLTKRQDIENTSKLLCTTEHEKMVTI